MSTEKYVNLTGVSRATAYRELTQLTEFGRLERTGQGRGTRYGLVATYFRENPLLNGRAAAHHLPIT